MANVIPVPPEYPLPVEQVRQITAEEQLRTRLRAEFDPKAKREHRSGWWEFLNSSFGLFLLSSVVLAGLTGLYSQAQYHSHQLELRNQEILKVTSELQYRLHQIRRYSEQMSKAAPGNKVGASRFIWYTIYGGPEYYHASLPEFSGVTTYGLVGRLRLLGVTDGTQKALDSIISLENGQTEPERDQTVYPQQFLDSQIQALSSYSDRVLIPYLDQQRNTSVWHRIFF
jgi:hypothetical protein